MLTSTLKFIYATYAYVCMVHIYKNKCILSIKGPKDGVHTFDTNRWHINIVIIFFHASFICMWYGCNNVTYYFYHTYNTCVPYNTYGPYCQMGVNCTYGACGTYGVTGHVGHVAVLVHVGHLLQMLFVGHMLHMSLIQKWFTHQWTFQMKINMCLQVGPQIK